MFAKLLPLANVQNIRVVLVNGPDYPGATPYNLEERVRLFSILAEATTNGDAALPNMVAFLKVTNFCSTAL